MDSSMGASSMAGDDSANPQADFQPAGVKPHISPEGFTVGIFIVLAVSTVTILARLALRLQRTKSLAVDDYFLVLAVPTLIAACALSQQYRDLYYEIIDVFANNEPNPTDLLQISMTETKVLTATSVLLWTAIFCVKFSFLFLFRKLIRRIRVLEIYWWTVFAVVLAAFLVSIPMSFYECTDFGPTLLINCPTESLIAREHVYLDVSVALDISTDILILILPTMLLWNVKINLKKKLTLIGIFSLSIVMIVIAIIRVALAPLTPTVIDTPFIFFLQILEAGIALVLISVSAFRGLFGQAGSVNYPQGGKGYVRSKAIKIPNDVEKGLSSTRNDSHPTISASRNLSVAASATPKGAIIESHVQSIQDDGIEMTTIASPSRARSCSIQRQTMFDERWNGLPTPPTETAGNAFERSQSPTTTRCWSDRQPRERSLSRGSMKDMVKHVRAKSRTPSLGEPLIEEKENK